MIDLGKRTNLTSSERICFDCGNCCYERLTAKLVPNNAMAAIVHFKWFIIDILQKEAFGENT